MLPSNSIKTEAIAPKITLLPMLPPCRICGERASGFHYGVNTCEACKGFFRRCLQKSMSGECTNEGKCNANSGKRNMCASCRYRTCIQVGMSKSAIKTGRYTHEKKTSNIREVKLLEAKASCSTDSPSSLLTNALINSSVLLTPESKSGEPMDVDDNIRFHYNPPTEHIPRNEKYEEVIENILTAYKEQTMHTMDFFSSLKEKEQEYLKEKKLYTEVFGSMKPVTADEYIKIYQATGLDIDGRRELIQSMIPRIENGMRRCIMFIKQLPGFRLLPVDDQISLIKMSRVEMGILIGHRLLNVEDRLFTFFWGETVAAEDLLRMHSSQAVDDMFSFAERMQNLQLTLIETILLSAIAIFAVVSRKEMWTILYHKAFNVEMDMVTLFWGDCIDRETLGALHGTEYIDAVFKVARNIQKLQLTHTETVIFAAFSLFFTDKCDLQCPEIVESSQQLLLDTFTYQLSRPQRDGHAKEHQKSHQNRRLLLARSLLVLPEMRTLTDTLRRAGQSFRSAWSVDAFQCPPLFHELLFLGQQNCVDDPVILQFEAELA